MKNALSLLILAVSVFTFQNIAKADVVMCATVWPCDDAGNLKAEFNIADDPCTEVYQNECDSISSAATPVKTRSALGQCRADKI